jgi:hypothetical protein
VLCAYVTVSGRCALNRWRYGSKRRAKLNVHHLLLVYECVHNTSLTHSTPPATFRLTAHGVSRLVAFVQEHKQQLAQQPGDPRTPEGRDFLY